MSGLWDVARDRGSVTPAKRGHCIKQLPETSPVVHDRAKLYQQLQNPSLGAPAFAIWGNHPWVAKRQHSSLLISLSLCPVRTAVCCFSAL